MEDIKHQAPTAPAPEYRFLNSRSIDAPLPNLVLIAERRYAMEQGDAIPMELIVREDTQVAESKDAKATPAPAAKPPKPTDLLSDAVTIWGKADQKSAAPLETLPSAAGFVNTSRGPMQYTILMNPFAYAYAQDAEEFLQKKIVVELASDLFTLVEGDIAEQRPSAKAVVDGLILKIERMRQDFNRGKEKYLQLQFGLTLAFTYVKPGNSQRYYAGFDSSGSVGSLLLRGNNTERLGSEVVMEARAPSGIIEIQLPAFSDPPDVNDPTFLKKTAAFCEEEVNEGDEVILCANLPKKGEEPKGPFSNLVHAFSTTKESDPSQQAKPITLTRMKLLPEDKTHQLATNPLFSAPLDQLLSYLNQYRGNVRDAIKTLQEALNKEIKEKSAQGVYAPDLEKMGQISKLEDIDKQLGEFIFQVNTLTSTVRGASAMSPETFAALSSMLWMTIDFLSRPITAESVARYEKIRTAFLKSGALQNAIRAERGRNQAWLIASSILFAGGTAFFLSGVLGQQAVFDNLSSHAGNLVGIDYAYHHAFIVGGGLALLIGLVGVYVCARDMRKCEEAFANGYDEHAQALRLNGRLDLLGRALQTAQQKKYLDNIKPVELRPPQPPKSFLDFFGNFFTPTTNTGVSAQPAPNLSQVAPAIEAEGPAPIVNAERTTGLAPVPGHGKSRALFLNKGGQDDGVSDRLQNQHEDLQEGVRSELSS